MTDRTEAASGGRLQTQRHGAGRGAALQSSGPGACAFRGPGGLRRLAGALLVASLLLLGGCTPGALRQGGTHWVGTWATAPVAYRSPRAPTPAFENRTLRLVVRTSIGGEQVRVRLSNAFGTEPLAVGAAHVAVRSAGAGIRPGSSRALTFGGASSVSIPAGGVAVSDPVALDVPALGDLAVSLYLPAPTPLGTVHPMALQTSYVSPAGNFADDAEMPVDTTLQVWPFLTGVDVRAPQDVGAIVTLGNSITDGASSEPDANRRWPNVLAERLLAGGYRFGVLNAGISGNRLLRDPGPDWGGLFGPSALSRFDADVLNQPGASHVIVLLGINDLGHPGSAAPAAEEVSADEIVAGLRQLIDRAHARGLRIFGATLLPFEDTTIPNYYNPVREAKRQAVNEWIRTGGAFDGVIDFDRALRDPSHPTRLLPAYDSGDHLHPNTAGLEAMGRAIDLALFRRE